MAAITYGRNVVIRSISGLKNHLHYGMLKRCSRFNSNLCNRNNSKLWTLQNSHWFNRKSNQIVNYYVKKKEREPGLSMSTWAAISGFVTGSLVYNFGCPVEGDIVDLYENEPAFMGYIYTCRDYVYRCRERFDEVRVSIVEPSSDCLLPDPVPAPYIQPKYTLVIELKDVLVHPEYIRSSGWRFRKRPGLNAFLKALSYPLFEIVIYTHENGMTADPLIDGFDTDQYIMYRLYRDATKYMEGTHVKDLSKLNRDITKIILLDCDQKTSMLQPRNSLVLKKWEGDTEDTSLLELIPFLHAIATSDVDDIRTVLDCYRNEGDFVLALRQYCKEKEELAKNDT